MEQDSVQERGTHMQPPKAAATGRGGGGPGGGARERTHGGTRLSAHGRHEPGSPTPFESPLLARKPRG